MTEQQQTVTLNKTRLAVFLALIAVFIFLAFAGILLAFDAENDSRMLPKEEITSNLSSMSDEDKGYSSVTKYLNDYGFAGYDSFKLRTVEAYYRQYTALDIEEPRILAIETAQLYLDYFYDKTDATDKTAVTDALLTCYIKATGDKYAVYRTPDQYEQYDEEMSGSFVGIGVTVQYNEEKTEITVVLVNEGGAAEKAGILVGDIIYAVDGKTVAELGYEGAVSAIRGEIDTDVTVTVLRGEEYIDFVCTRAQIVERTVRYELDANGIGYVQITGFKENTASLFCEAIDFLEENDCKGIIFDLRNNPGGYLNSVIAVIDYLVPSKTRIVSYKYAQYDESVYYATDGHEIDVPITVLCNQNTASAGELFTAAMRDYNDMGILEATIVGVNTYSKGVMQNTFMLSDGSTLTLTVAYYNPPCNVNYDGVGVKPDVEIENDSTSDLQLERAYLEISTLINY